MGYNRVTDHPGQTMQQAKWNIGQLVHHKLFGYRGVIYDVDPVYMLADDWYENVATSRPPKDEPWYRIIVDNELQETYVAQQNLEPASDLSPINNPLLDVCFISFEDGHYVRVRNS